MTENPYTPPTSTDALTPRRFQRLCAAMFWIASVLSVIAAYIGVSTGYSTHVAMQEMGGKIPLYIIAVTILSVCCSICLAYSAVRWRKCKIRSGTIALVLAVLAFFIGPFILLFTMVGLPNG